MIIRQRDRASSRESCTTSEKNRVRKFLCSFNFKSKSDFLLPSSSMSLDLLRIMSNPLYNLHNSTQAPGAGQRPIYPTFSQRFAPPTTYTAPPAARSSSVESDDSRHSHSTVASRAESVFERNGGAYKQTGSRARSASTAATSLRGSTAPPASPRDKENHTKALPKSKSPRNNNGPAKRTRKAKSSLSPSAKKDRLTAQKRNSMRKTVERDALRKAFSSGFVSAQTVSFEQVDMIKEKAVKDAQRAGKLPKQVEKVAEEGGKRSKMANDGAKEKIKAAIVLGSEGDLSIDMERLMKPVARGGKQKKVVV